MFIHRLLTSLENKPPVVVGIDPDLDRIRSLYPSWTESILSEKIPPSEVAVLYGEYGKAIIDAVSDLVPAIKFQIAFFERCGHHGIQAVEDIIGYAHSKGLLVIADIKRGDVPSTAEAYAAAYMGGDPPASPLVCDAVTINPYLGRDSWQPFLRRTHPPISSGVFLLLKTSNPGSGDLQDVTVQGRKLYEQLSILLKEEIGELPDGGYSNIGAVVGATYPESARRIRRLLPHSFLLVPGLGAQGGDLSQIGSYLNPDGKGALFHFSRSIIYPESPSSGTLEKSPQLIRRDIREAALRCLEEVGAYLPKR